MIAHSVSCGFAGTKYDSLTIALSVCLSRMCYSSDVSNVLPVVGVALLHCCVRENGSDLDLLGADFFDDESMVLLYRCQEERTFIGMFDYNDLGYQNLRLDVHIKGLSREDLVQRVVQLWNEGHIASDNIPIKSCRELISSKEDEASLAVNGRVGRRVACLLYNKGSTMEILDMEGNGEADENVESEAE